MAASSAPRRAGLPTVGLLYSGGLDSSILLANLLDQGLCVQPFYVDCGLHWQTEEYAAALAFVRAMERPTLQTVVRFELPLHDLYGNHWSTTGQNVPDAQSPDEDVFLPGRNALLLIKPALWCQMHAIDHLMVGALSSNPFGDATDDFFRTFERLLSQSGHRTLRVSSPLATWNKPEVIRHGQHLDLPLELTFSCIAPRQGLHCGQCNKCGERRRAFEALNIPDPTNYAPHMAATS